MRGVVMESGETFLVPMPRKTSAEAVEGYPQNVEASQGALAHHHREVTAPRRAFLQRRWLWGSAVGLIWFVVFSAGILIDAQPHREALGWKTDDVRQDAIVGKLTQQILRAVGPSSTSDDLARRPDQAISALQLLTSTIQSQQSKATRLVTLESDPWKTLYHFAGGMLLFTPINVALLALLAGFIGGCASNESDREIIQQQIARSPTLNEQILLKRRLAYLEEHPAYSMMRSFIVYLVFISGLYVVSSDPFSPATQAQGFTQYIRLAGLVSLLGFVVGYDPTRFKHWLDMIPSPVQMTPAAAASNARPSPGGARLTRSAKRTKDPIAGKAMAKSAS